MQTLPFNLKIGFKFLEWTCSIDHIEIVQGDLTELYTQRREERGTLWASIRFYQECLSLSYQYWTKGKSEYYLNNFAMLKNYFLIAIRNLIKNRTYSFINILGLALGIAGAILIYQYITIERNFDKRSGNSKRIVRVTSEWFQDNEFLEHRAAGVPALEQLFDNTYPEVLTYARYHEGAPNVVRYFAANEKEVRFEEKDIYYADASFLDIFDIEFVKGNPATALGEPNKVVITEEIAQKYFGDENPLGETLKFNGEFDFSCQVSGVIRDFEKESHLAGNMVISLQTKVNLVPFEVYDNWIWRSFYTYLVVEPQIDLVELQDKINAGVKRKIGDFYEQRSYKVNFHLQPVEDIHLESNLFEEMEVNGDIKTVNYLSIACIFLLLIAAFNYINLTTAKNLYRAKEVGVRKVVGAFKFNLTLQYLTESVMIFGIAMTVSLGLIYITFPYLRTFLQLGFELSILHSSSFWLLFAMVWLVGGVLSGLYPALVLTSMQPTVVLKGNFKSSTGNQLLRKSLVTFQVALSLGLAISVLIITQQIGHMRGRDLGVRKDNILVVNGPKIKDQSYLSNLETFKQRLEAISTVEHMSTVSSLVGEVTGAGRDFRNEEGLSQFLRIIRVEYDFEKVMELETMAGTTFSKEHAADSGLVLNEAAARQMGYANVEEALNRTITWRNVSTSIQSNIVGVVKDYYPSAQSEAVPTVFILNRTYSAPWDPEFYVTSLAASTFEEAQGAVRDIEMVWNETFPADPFNFYFVEDFYNQQFRAEVTFGRILTLFSSLAIVLACIGILALASFSNFMRQKEIGIRKVLGSTEFSIHLLLLKEYVLYILLGTVLITPFIYYLFSIWLEGFSYRITISIWYFVLPVCGLLLINIVMILFQSHRIVTINPVKVLRSE